MFLTAGCSFTSPDTECDGPMWPEILSYKLNMDHKNVGVAGASNQEIFHQIVDNIQEVNYIFVVWTGFTREYIYTRSFNPVYWKYREDQGLPQKQNGLMDYETNLLSKHFDPIVAYKNNMRWKNAARLICKSKGVKLFSQQGVKPFPDRFHRSLPDDIYLNCEDFYVGATMEGSGHPTHQGHEFIASKFYDMVLRSNIEHEYVYE